MAHLLAILIPIIWAVGLAVAVLRWQYRGRLMYFGLALVALIAVGALTLGPVPNYLWSVLLAAVLLAIAVIVLVMSRDSDFLLGRYAHWLSRWLALAAMIWWFAAIFLAK